MDVLKQLIEKQTNPLGWLFTLLFFILFCFGFWHHNWAIIIIALAGMVASSWYFPKPTKPVAWTNDCIKAATEWLDKPFDTEKTVVSAVGIIAFFVLLISLWVHATGLIFISAIVLIANKAYLMRKCLMGMMPAGGKKKTKEPQSQQRQNQQQQHNPQHHNKTDDK